VAFSRYKCLRSADREGFCRKKRKKGKEATHGLLYICTFPHSFNRGTKKKKFLALSLGGRGPIGCGSRLTKLGGRAQDQGVYTKK